MDQIIREAGIGQVGRPQSSALLAGTVVCLILAGAALWFVSAMGLDPGNILAQKLDLLNAHLPSAQYFAERPFLDALMHYPAAPLPLFYVVAGGILALGGSMFTLQIATVCVGLLLLWFVYLQATRNRGFPSVAALGLVAAVMISPWFRGTTVYANTDPLPLAFLAAAFVFADRQSSPRPGAALALACLAVWTRQFYVFGAMAIFARYARWQERGHTLRLVLIGLAMSAPVFAVFAYWGGPTPPQFRYHIASSGPLTTVPVLLSIAGIYMVPSMLATARFHRGAFLADARRPVFLLCLALLAAMSIAVALETGDFDHSISGGGAAVVGLERFGVPASVRGVLMGLAAFLMGAYIAYIVLQAPRINSIILFVLLAFVPTTIIFQRYFDPLFIILLGCVVRTRESESIARSWLILLYPALELALSVVSFYHYGPMLGGSAGAS